MSYYDVIYEIAVDHNYLVTTAEARAAGVPAVELAKLAYRGRLQNLARGLYRLSRNVPSESDPYAVAVARLGEGAYLYGESVLALLNLAPTDPGHIFVATPRRIRSKLPKSIRVKKPEANDVVTTYEGIPSQDVVSALRSAKNSMMLDRLRDAAYRAQREGYITKQSFDDLAEEMGWA